MKLQIVNPVAVSKRCQYRTASGRQCRLDSSDLHSGLCSRHLADQRRKQASDVRSDLIKHCYGFQSAQGINHSLGALYLLLAENRVSARRAAVLAYIASQLLRTLPAIDSDRKHGISHSQEVNFGFPGTKLPAHNTTPTPVPSPASSSTSEPLAHPDPDPAPAITPSPNTDPGPGPATDPPEPTHI